MASQDQLGSLRRPDPLQHQASRRSALSQTGTDDKGKWSTVKHSIIE